MKQKAGADHDDWGMVVATLMHEAQEVCLSRLCLRFTPSDEFGRDAASYVFMMRHEQFSDAVARTALFLADWRCQSHSRLSAPRRRKDACREGHSGHRRRNFVLSEISKRGRG